MVKIQGVKMLSNAIKLDFDDYYNCENRLVKMLSETQKLEFIYDYLGRRREKKIFTKENNTWTLTTHKSFIYNHYKLIKETDELASKTMQFVWLGDTLLALEANGTAYNYLADGNKNICQLINLNTGATANRYDYTPFGKLTLNTESVANQFKFSSEYAETETNLVYYNYRYYNPTDGKWLSRDPIGENGGWNIYGFVGNNSVINSDKLGLVIWWTNQKKVDKNKFKKYLCLLRKLGLDKTKYQATRVVKYTPSPYETMGSGITHTYAYNEDLKVPETYKKLEEIVENDNIFYGRSKILGIDTGGSIAGQAKMGDKIMIHENMEHQHATALSVLMHEARHRVSYVGDLIARDVATYNIEDIVLDLIKKFDSKIDYLKCCSKSGNVAQQQYSEWDLMKYECGVGPEPCAGKKLIERSTVPF